MALLGVSPQTLPNFLRLAPPQSKFSVPHHYSMSFYPYQGLTERTRSSPSPCFSVDATTAAVDDPESLGLENLRRFFDLNIGKWNGCFYQFDAHGKTLQKIQTKLSVSSYGEDDLISLIQSLYVKHLPSWSSNSENDGEAEWAEYKIKESNIFTVDKYQQIALFSNEKAFALRYQTAGMLENVLRQGVLGEDDIEEKCPKNLKLPSLYPSVVCENCLYSRESDKRARAFHIIDPKGVLEMLLVFLEERNSSSHPEFHNEQDGMNRILPFLGQWQGYSITKRSGVYGSTLDEADTVSLLKIDENGHLIQNIRTRSKLRDAHSNLCWKGTICENLVTFDGGYQITLLPGGMYMGYPSDIAKHVAETKSFHLEFCWLENSSTRQRLVRTFDVEGLAVSSTYFYETLV